MGKILVGSCHPYTMNPCQILECYHACIHLGGCICPAEMREVFQAVVISPGFYKLNKRSRYYHSGKAWSIGWIATCGLFASVNRMRITGSL